MGDLSLIEAVKADNYAEAEELIKQGADINQQDEQGWTPLNFAAGKGNLSLVRLLVECGADIFKVGRDRRTPYMIALAAVRVSVAEYLSAAEDNCSGEKPASPERKYCKAYYLKELRQYPMWSESRIDWKTRDNDNSEGEAPFTDQKVVFIHQGFTVTESMWENENIIFNNVDSSWKEFCSDSLKFKAPSDMELMVPNEAGG